VPDTQLECCDCKKQFTWTERDQAFYTQQGFDKPKRCKDCRAKRKEDSLVKIAIRAVEAWEGWDGKPETKDAVGTAIERLKDAAHRVRK